MSTSRKMDIASEIESGGPISEATLAYLEQRVVNGFYAYVLGRFSESKLKQSELARRINRGTDVVNRWLRSPGNWQIGTAARLLVGICGEEALLSSAPWAGRRPQNQSVLSLLDEDEDEPDVPQIKPLPTTSSTAKTARSVLQLV